MKEAEEDTRVQEYLAKFNPLNQKRLILYRFEWQEIDENGKIQVIKRKNPLRCLLSDTELNPDTYCEIIGCGCYGALFWFNAHVAKHKTCPICQEEVLFVNFPTEAFISNYKECFEDDETKQKVMKQKKNAYKQATTDPEPYLDRVTNNNKLKSLDELISESPNREFGASAEFKKRIRNTMDEIWTGWISLWDKERKNIYKKKMPGKVGKKIGRQGQRRKGK